MPTMSRHLSPILLLLCLAIAGSPLSATPGGPRKELPRAPVLSRSAAPADLVGRLWHHLTALWGAEGCGIDPNGARCATSATPPAGPSTVLPPAPAGCGIDPSGRCSR